MLISPPDRSTALPDWPDARQEEFRYTSLSSLTALNLAAGRSSLQLLPLPQGVSCTALGDNETALFSALPNTPLVKRALAAADAGWHLKASGRIDAPLDLRLTGDMATAPRLALSLSDEAHLTLIEEIGIGCAPLTNQIMQINLGRNASLTHLRLQRAESGIVHLSTCAVQLVGEGASYTQISLNCGAALARQASHITLAARHTQASVNVINLLGGTQQGDVTADMIHTSPHGRSQQLVRSVLTARARCAFQGTIRVAPGAQKTEARQNSKALLLSPHAEMNSKPELEILADDVSCSHGATTGSLDAHSLYYLRARGLSEAQARLLLVRGFVDEVLDILSDDSLRARLDREVSRWMSEEANP